jgi:hypothetical protein
MPRAPIGTALTTVFILLLSVSPAAAQTPAGSVVGVGGQVSLDRGGQRFPLAIGTPVFVGDTFQVPDGAKVKLRMSDGSILSVAPGSTLRIDGFDASGRRLSLGGGLLRSVTVPTGQPFEVSTAVGTSGVRSTDWFVEAMPGYQQTAVLSGSVALTSRSTGGSVTIPAGMGSRLDAGLNPLPPRVWSQAEFAAFIARSEGAAAPPPTAPPPAAPPGNYYPPPSPYSPTPYPPGGYYPPGGVIQIPLPGGGGGYRPPRGDGRYPPGGYQEPGGQRGDSSGQRGSRDSYPR